MKKFIVGVFALGLFSTMVSAEEKSKIRVQGGIAPIENIFKKIDKAFTAETGIQLEIKESSSEDALIAVENGEADLAVTGVPWDGLLDLLKKANKKLKDEKALISNQIGRDKRVVLINKKTNVKKLDQEQLMKMATGKFKNWKEVGGADLKIQMVFAEKSPGLYAFWKKKIMNDQEWYMENSKKLVDVAAAKKFIIENPGAYTIAPSSFKSDGDILVPEMPVFGVPLTAYIKGKPSNEIVKLYAFIKGNGQKLVE